MRAWLIAVVMIVAAGQAGAKEAPLDVEGDPDKGWSIIRQKDEITDGPVVFAGLRGSRKPSSSEFSPNDTALMICKRGKIILTVYGIVDGSGGFGQLTVGIRFDQNQGHLVTASPVSLSGRSAVFDNRELIDLLIEGAPSSGMLLLQIDDRGVPIFNNTFPAENGAAAMNALREACP